MESGVYGMESEAHVRLGRLKVGPRGALSWKTAIIPVGERFIKQKLGSGTQVGEIYSYAAWVKPDRLLGVN